MRHLSSCVRDSVPFAYCGSYVCEASGRPFSEAAAAETGLTVRPGHRLMSLFV